MVGWLYSRLKLWYIWKFSKQVQSTQLSGEGQMNYFVAHFSFIAWQNDSSVDQTLRTSSFNFQLSSSWKPNIQLSQMTQIYRKLVVTILKTLTWNLPILNDPNKYKSLSKLNKLLGSLFYKYGNLLYISTYITQIYNRKTLKRQSI